MEKGKKCPNCGYVSSDKLDYCPNCDRFETRVFHPLTVEDVSDLNKVEELKQQEELLDVPVEEPTPEAVVAEIEEVVTAEVATEEVASESTPDIASEDSTPETVVEEAAPVAEEPVESEVVVAAPAAVTPPAEEIKKYERPQIEAARQVVAQADQAEAQTEQPTAKQTAPVSKEKETPSPKSKRNRWVALFLLLVVLLGGAYTMYQRSVHKKEAAQLVEWQKEAALLSVAGEKLYLNEEHVFLSESFTEADLTALKTKVAALDEQVEKKDLEAMLADLTARAEKQTTLNNYFQTALIKGDQLATDGILKDSLAQLPTAISPEVDAFDRLVNEGQAEIATQVKLNTAAADLMKKVYDKEVTKEATDKMVEAAQASVAKLKDPQLKATYGDQLKEVEKALKGKAEQAKADKAKEAAAEQAKKNKAQKGTLPGSQGVTTQANKDTITYVDVPEEGAWAWAPGIKEQVLAECLKRGYIVEGGYILRQKEVLNGEGYYDLYATSTGSKLLKNRGKGELPIYLVTINAKTGWFKGEGPN